MENSGNILTGEENSPVWFVVEGENWTGPMTVQEVLEKIQQAELTWAHFAWKQGLEGWRRICDIPAFQTAVPQPPAQDLAKKISAATPPPTPKKKALQRIWFLHYNDSQFGPFATEEIERLIQVRKIHGRVFIWKDGMSTWERVEKVSEFKDVLSFAATPAVKAPPSPPKGPTSSTAVEDEGSQKGDLRGTPRRPLVARIFVASEETVITGMCRDISVGGMQVLTDFIPGPAGTQVKMNISPSGGDLGGNIAPFVAEGVVVRVLEDKRGFSFRFEKLPGTARQAIEAYIASTD